MADNDALDRIASLLPAEQRERYYAIVSRLREMPEDDEVLLIVEAIGFMTLLWREVPSQIEAILTKAEPVDGQVSRETTAYLLDQLKTALRETLDLPSYEDLRKLMQELQDGRRAFHTVVKQLESTSKPKPHRLIWKNILVLAVTNMIAIGGIFYWFHEQHLQRLAQIESSLPTVETIVRTLGQPPIGNIRLYEGHDASLQQGIRALIVEGPVIDSFTDKAGRGIIRLRAAR